MPYKYEWTDDSFIARFSGELNLKEIRECDDINDGSQYFDDLSYSIWDFTEIETVNLTEYDVRIIASIDHVSSRTNPRLKVLLIINKDALKPLAEFYKRSVKDLPWEIHIFETYEQVIEWKSRQSAL